MNQNKSITHSTVIWGKFNEQKEKSEENSKEEHGKSENERVNRFERFSNKCT